MGFLVLFVLALKLQAATTTVILGPGITFNPNSITVQVGDTVHWDNSTGSGGFHNVAPNGGTEPVANGTGSGWTYDYVFNNPGAFAYYCQVHGLAMSGVVNVDAPPTPTDTETPTCTISPTDVPPGSTVTDTPTPSPSATNSPVLTDTPTATMTATPTAGMQMIKLFEHSPELILAPNPQKVGDPICLYSNSIPQESHWDVYDTAAERAASLDFRGSALQCWDTSKAVPGLYYVDVHWTLANGGVKHVKQKVVLWR